MGIFWLGTPFSGGGGNGVFWLRNPLFPILGILTPVRGKRSPNLNTPSTAGTFRKRFRNNSEKTPRNALRAFPGIPFESTAGEPQILRFKAFEASRAFPELTAPQYGWGRVPEKPLRAGHRIPSTGRTLQPETIAKLIPKTLFHVTEMRFSKKIIPKPFFHVNLWITNEYVKGNSREINSRIIFSCSWNVIFREINSENKNLCM